MQERPCADFSDSLGGDWRGTKQYADSIFVPFSDLHAISGVPKLFLQKEHSLPGEMGNWEL